MVLNYSRRGVLCRCILLNTLGDGRTWEQIKGLCIVMSRNNDIILLYYSRFDIKKECCCKLNLKGLRYLLNLIKQLIYWLSKF